tara:strand:- start:3388 stop:4131 length:744 start_codon:yes stop_codon:yes gene_type:complete
MTIDTIYIIIFFLIITVQTIVGVGVLVLGTPIMLLFQHTLPGAIEVLLPISILTSLINIFYFKIIKKLETFEINKKTTKYFIYLCLPSIFLGTYLLKTLHDFINFKILVSSIILFTLFVKLFSKNNIIIFSNLKKKIFLVIIGLVHGLTNSGGTLLSIFILSLNNNAKKETRYDITFFYLFLAIFQYLIFIIFFKSNITINLLLNYLIIVFFGVLFGNIIEKKIKKKTFPVFIDILALLTGIFLLIL